MSAAIIAPVIDIIDIRILSSSITVRRVRPVNDCVLEQHLVQRLNVGVVMCVLQADAAEFAGVEFQQRGFGARDMAEIIERAAPEILAYAIGSELRVTQTETPARHELVHAL